MLDARIASTLNKIIQNSYFKKKVSLEEQKAQKEDPFLRGRQIAFMICNFFRVTGTHDAALDYSDLFSVTLRDGNIQEFTTKWDEVLFSVSKIPSDDIKKASVRKETNAVSGMRVTIVSKKPEHNAATPCEPTLSRGGMCVKEEKHPRQK